MNAAPSPAGESSPRRLIIGISGASGAILGIRTLEVLRAIDGVETHLVITPAAEITIAHETDRTPDAVRALADVVHSIENLAAPIASGSFRTVGMIVVPCSIKTLSAIANAYADNLLTRAADVTLKEGRSLLLVVRETPLHRGHLRLMAQAADAGAVIFPPVPAFYARPRSMDDLISQTVGRILARIDIENDLYRTWNPGANTV